MAGRPRRIDLSTLAAEPVHQAQLPRFIADTSVGLDQLASNPLNTRKNLGDLDGLAASLTSIGQSTPCAVVTRGAFLAIFPEFAPEVGACPYVAVTGARRRAAAALAQIPRLDIVVKEQFASSRLIFLTATASENIDRADYDAIEEAEAVQLIVTELGSGKDAAEHFHRTKGWVSQRLSLLKLAPEIQAMVRQGTIPLRDTRKLTGLPASEQLTAWKLQHDQAQEKEESVPKEQRLTTAHREGGLLGASIPGPIPVPRAVKPASPVASASAAIQKLGGTPQKLAEALRSELSPDDLKALVELLMANI